MSEKSEAAANRELAVLERAPLVVRAADGKLAALTADGLVLVEKLGRAGSTQNYIASKLGVTQGAFKKLLGRAEEETEARLAWERGRAAHEQDIIRQLLAHGKKNVVALIFYSKAKLHWKENEPDAGFTSNIQITLPDSMTKEQYYATLGIDGPIDTRKIKDVTPPSETSSKPADEPRLRWQDHYRGQPLKPEEN